MRKQEVEQEHIKFQERWNKDCLKYGHPIEDYKFVAVGYLSIDEEFKKGVVSQRFINKLRQVWNEGSILGSLGHHDCEFCIDEGNYEGRVTSSSEKVLIDRKNNIKYIFPEMIFHYIEKHNYLPPEDFIFFILRERK